MVQFLIIVIILFAFYQLTQGKKTSSLHDKGNTIGQRIKRDGYYYTNIGDLEGNDNWVAIDKYLPIYYVNVIQTGKKEFLIKIEDNPNEDAIDEIECEAEEDVKMYVQFMKDTYSGEGTVKVDDRMEDIERILLTHPFYVEKRSWLQD